MDFWMASPQNSQGSVLEKSKHSNTLHSELRQNPVHKDLRPTLHPPAPSSPVHCDPVCGVHTHPLPK